MGCARFIWNAKCDEHRYYSIYTRKYFPLGTYAPVDQKAAQFKSKKLTSWFYQYPGQIIRNSATNWCNTYQKFMKGICGKPRRKRKTDKASMYLTREVFSFNVVGIDRGVVVPAHSDDIAYDFSDGAKKKTD